MNLVEVAVAEFGFFETGDEFVELQKKVREELRNWGACIRRFTTLHTKKRRQPLPLTAVSRMRNQMTRAHACNGGGSKRARRTFLSKDVTVSFLACILQRLLELGEHLKAQLTSLSAKQAASLLVQLN